MSKEVDKSKSLEDQVAAFMSSKKVTNEIASQASNMNGRIGRLKKNEAKYYANKLKTILSREVKEIVSRTTGKPYLNYIAIDTEVKQKKKAGEMFYSIGLNFSKKYMHRNSLIPAEYPEGVNIAYIMHTGYAYNKKKAPKGKDRHGNRVLAWHKRKANPFVARALAEFNKDVPSHVQATSSDVFGGKSKKKK